MAGKSLKVKNEYKTYLTRIMKVNRFEYNFENSSSTKYR